MDSFAALSDPTRRAILERLAQREMAAGDIVAAFSLSAPAISQHLKALRQAGLVRVRSEGQRRIYRLDPEGLDGMEAWIDRTRSFWSARLDALAAALETPDDDTETNR